MEHHNPNPTFCATWSELFSVEVDLSKVTSQTDRSELIYRAEYLPLDEVLSRIGKGEFEGVNYRSATANDAFFVWLARHPRMLEHAAYWHNFDDHAYDQDDQHARLVADQRAQDMHDQFALSDEEILSPVYDTNR